MKWIKIEDQLPKEDQCVIYYFKETGVACGRYKKTSGGGDMFFGKCGFLTDDVTYWMPMPEPPVVISSEEDYNLYLAELETLLDKDPELDSSDGVRLYNLATAVEEYEKEHFPIDEPSEEELKKFREENEG